MNRISLTLLLLIMMSTVAAASTVYKSVQPDGTVRFSDKPPGQDGDVEVIQLPRYAPVSVPDSNKLVADMAATADRLREDRLRREAERTPSQPATPAPASGEYDPPILQPWHYPVPYRSGYRRPYHDDRERDRARDWERDHRYPAPDRRSERDRRRDNMGGTWYIPKRLPGLESRYPER